MRAVGRSWGGAKSRADLTRSKCSKEAENINTQHRKELLPQEFWPTNR